MFVLSSICSFEIALMCIYNEYYLLTATHKLGPLSLVQIRREVKYVVILVSE